MNRGEVLEREKKEMKEKDCNQGGYKEGLSCCPCCLLEWCFRCLYKKILQTRTCILGKNSWVKSATVRVGDVPESVHCYVKPRLSRDSTSRFWSRNPGRAIPGGFLILTSFLRSNVRKCDDVFLPIFYGLSFSIHVCQHHSQIRKKYLLHPFFYPLY